VACATCASTTPTREKEEQEYVDAIIEMVRWLGFGLGRAFGVEHLYYASNYFDFMYTAAEALIEAAWPMWMSRRPSRCAPPAATSPRAGTDSPWRDRTSAENLARFREMRDGQHADGAMVLRAKIDMASPNINCATRRSTASSAPRTTTPATAGASTRCTPMRTRSRTRWRTSRTASARWSSRTSAPSTTGCWGKSPADGLGLLAHPLPKQYEFGRLNLTYVITSKRKLKALVDEGHRAGLGRPAHAHPGGPAPARLHAGGASASIAEDTGASKTNIWIDYSVLDIALRDDLEGQAARAMAVLDPLPLKLTNWDRGLRRRAHRTLQAPAHPQRPELGQRQFGSGREVWIERDDFAEVPVKGFFRLFPRQQGAAEVRLGVECTGCEKDADGRVTAVLATVVPDTKSGTPGADSVKVKGTITWVARTTPCRRSAPVRPPVHRAAARCRRARLPREPEPGQQGRWCRAMSSRRWPAAEDRFQFERHGYFVADRKDHQPRRAGVQPHHRAEGLPRGALLQSMTAGGTVQGHESRAELQLRGGVSVQRLRVAVLPQLEAPLLGMDVLSRLHFTQGNGVLRLRATPP
jgi:glutaminyl-tRNA synthetase